MSLYKFPLTGYPSTFSASLPTGIYQFRLVYSDSPDGDGGWILDIGDVNGTALVCGIPLVTGADLLAQYAYLNLGGKLFCTTAGDPSAPPTFDNLGTTANLYFET